MKELARKQLPEGARNFTASLEGYAFILGKGMTMCMQPVMPFRVEYEAPKKRSDGFTKKKQVMNVTANFCPFCGKSAKVDEEAIAHD
ncbi:hypothetical protein [Vreelandella titanicae]|uniref:hypothetical protein n=1 Tax=Vreelandella titanicae TaxID=664683 RepID=UPI0011404C3C|nr:hypothetical protein [Halomonas titanicae]